ncbi:hypothetical protein PGAG_00399 [Phaeocystis globosa virus 12T]|uniref:Uncharacterized protein n=1 Tax=Phaeocystis globosa virus PgV-16T TaxID=3071227 RepID=A0AC59EWL8_9VIRU|nr:hypothetical protein PGCG_00036 [Phaeocystis globosa virus]AET72853.1 hypothetical protein PGAG_00399 [Phaeocystis globosa virus 12T]AET73649.1 hypothetical protein PGBG_00433 [Phaeocystis globosa virus 14T]AGM15348.1 hypothetical protein PGCG_00036 [Phaeocystis globosa virus PgV-16T]UYE94078.1 hypothetical protein PGV14T_00036 [Phaeocystis globosa virus]
MTTMTNAQITSLKNRLRTHFDMDRVLETFSEEVWENNNYGEAYENLTEEKFMKYFAEAMLNPMEEEDEDVEKPMCWECGVSRCDDIEFSICECCMNKPCIDDDECCPEVNMDDEE